MIARQAEQVASERPQMRGGSGTVHMRALSAFLPDNARLFSLITLKPGTSIGYHVHENETELFYFASGSGIATDDDQKVRVAAGDSMATPSGHGHAVENDGREDLVIVAAIVRD